MFGGCFWHVDGQHGPWDPYVVFFRKMGRTGHLQNLGGKDSQQQETRDCRQ